MIEGRLLYHCHNLHEHSGEAHSQNFRNIIFAGSLFVNFAQSANMIMRGEGILKKAMLITGTGAVLNIILDPIMITAMPARISASTIRNASVIVQEIFLYCRWLAVNRSLD